MSQFEVVIDELKGMYLDADSTAQMEAINFHHREAADVLCRRLDAIFKKVDIESPERTGPMVKGPSTGKMGPSVPVTPTESVIDKKMREASPPAEGDG